MTKSELLEQLRATGDDVAAKLDKLDEASLAAGRYESGWNGKQILAHMASIEWTYPRLLDIAKQAASGQTPKPSETAPPPPQQANPQQGSPQILDYNERQVARRAGASTGELVDEFRKNRAALIAAVEAADDALFSQPIASAGGARGPLADVLNFVAVQHVRGHLADLLGQPQAAS